MTDEGEPSRVVDLETLGPHIGRTLLAHKNRHEEGKTRVERVRRLEELRGRVSNLVTSEELVTQGSTHAYHVEKHSTGAEVSAAVSSTNGRGVYGVAKELVGDNDNRVYLSEGPHSARLGSEPFMESELGDKRLTSPKAGSLSLNLTLETRHEVDIDPTKDMVWIGAVLDPESILVPEESEDGQPNLLSVIGPDDSRFGPIMEVLSHVNEGVGSGGETAGDN